MNIPMKLYQSTLNRDLSLPRFEPKYLHGDILSQLLDHNSMNLVHVIFEEASLLILMNPPHPCKIIQLNIKMFKKKRGERVHILMFEIPSMDM